jgi:hypothetical protein
MLNALRHVMVEELNMYEEPTTESERSTIMFYYMMYTLKYNNLNQPAFKALQATAEQVASHIAERHVHTLNGVDVPNHSLREHR